MPLDFGVPIGVTRRAVVPQSEDAMLQDWLQMRAHEAEPLDFAVARMLRLVFVAVADEDDRFDRYRHAYSRDQRGNVPAHACKSSGWNGRRGRLRVPQAPRRRGVVVALVFGIGQNI